MKKLKDFEADKISLKNVWGGTDKVTSSQRTLDNGCVEKTSDIHSDNNNNGILDSGDSYQSCTTTLCP